MAQIRQDPRIQSQADLIMNSIKTNCPVFGQNPSQGAPILSGINPLSHGQGLQSSQQLPQLGQQTLQPNQGFALGQQGSNVSNYNSLPVQLGQHFGHQVPYRNFVSFSYKHALFQIVVYHLKFNKMGN